MKRPICITPFLVESELQNAPDRPIARFWTLVRSCKAAAIVGAAVALVYVWGLWRAAEEAQRVVPQGQADVWEKSPTARDAEQRERMSFAL